ncbi:MAG: 4'-phosphopantetheinyl transferase superfamily protein [Paludibacteraceae bacterium]|nr:4'-phosphopantetheinyl transferase superfamily protein [Paludibacteraceae bacterium]
MRIAVFDDMSQCTTSAVEQMLPQVSAQRREQALRYKHTLGQFCCLKSWLMLNELSAVCGHHSDFLYNEHGKPYWPDGPFFSISHCQQGIAVAVDDKPIGIDIEAIRHAEESLIERVMNDEERRLIAKAYTNADRVFTRLWTQKEAILKMLGTGIESFEQLQTILSECQNTGISEYPQIQTVEKEKYIYTIANGK